MNYEFTTHSSLVNLLNFCADKRFFCQSSTYWEVAVVQYSFVSNSCSWKTPGFFVAMLFHRDVSTRPIDVWLLKILSRFTKRYFGHCIIMHTMQHEYLLLLFHSTLESAALFYEVKTGERKEMDFLEARKARRIGECARNCKCVTLRNPSTCNAISCSTGLSCSTAGGASSMQNACMHYWCVLHKRD